MSEFSETQIPPMELQQPPTFTDVEAAAALSAIGDYDVTRKDVEGNEVFDTAIMGATYDGTVVSMDTLTLDRYHTAADSLDIDQEIGAEQGTLDLADLPEDTRNVMSQTRRVIRVGHISQLVSGNTLPEQRVSVLDSMSIANGLAFRGSGSLTKTNFGDITYNASRVGDSEFARLPQLDGKVIFPIGEDGKPFLPVPAKSVESVVSQPEDAQPLSPDAPQLAQVSVGGMRKFFGRRK